MADGSNMLIKLLLQSSYSADILHQLCNLHLSGGLPESIIKIFAGARLIALKKGENISKKRFGKIEHKHLCHATFPHSPNLWQSLINY